MKSKWNVIRSGELFALDSRNESLEDTVVLLARGRELSEDAQETIRHMRTYVNSKGAMALLGDQVAVLLNVADPDEMEDRAVACAEDVSGSMPDFEPVTMDDDCGLVMMRSNVMGFRPYGLSTAESMANLGRALVVRQSVLEACEEPEVLALVYFSGKDWDRLAN